VWIEIPSSRASWAIGPMPTVRREELRRVRREIARQRAELAILGRAAAVLAEDGLTVA